VYCKLLRLHTVAICAFIVQCYDNGVKMMSCAVERYDPRLNRWMSVAPMGTRRKHLGVAVFLNMIYAVGGRDDATELSSAERYNPQTNTWQPVVAMTSRRSGVCLCLHWCIIPL